MSKVNLLQSNAASLLNQVAQSPKSGETKSFSATLNEMVSQVNKLQKDTAQSVENFITTGEGNLHQVMASVEEASLSFQLMMEIRNKLLESYQELSRMQV